MSTLKSILLIMCVCAVYAQSLNAADAPYHGDPTSAPNPVWPPKGTPVKCKVSRDTSTATVKDEKYSANGKVTRLKLKSQQEHILFDGDLSPIKGKIITGALWHVRIMDEKWPFRRVGVSSFASEWVEGNNKVQYGIEEGASCYVQAEYKKRDWAFPGSSVMDVSFGLGNTIWRFADASEMKEGWQSVAIEPDVVAARLAGLSHGFFVMDENGSEWSFKNDKFGYTYVPNRYCYSIEDKKNASWLEIWVADVDIQAPGSISKFKVETEQFPAGQALVMWETPKDSGGGKTLGFHVSYSVDGKTSPVPRYLIPMAKKPGDMVKMHLQDLPFKANQKVELAIRAVDSVGNVGPEFRQSIQVSGNPKVAELNEQLKNRSFTDTAALPEVAGIKVSALDVMDKVDPRSGELIPQQAKGYKTANHVFSGKQKLIRLQSAKNETVAFQLNFEGKADAISVNVELEDKQIAPSLSEFAYVMTKSKDGEKALPDPLFDLGDSFSIPSKRGEVLPKDQTNHSIIVELHVPHEVTAGQKKGSVLINAQGQTLALNLSLEVWDFTLPNKLSFVPEMNMFGWTWNPFRDKDYQAYRLAHKHRTMFNCLPYGWNGNPTFAPSWDGQKFYFSKWDEKMGPLLDGSAFKGLPRDSEPVSYCYLPFNENFPSSLYDNYKPNYWVNEAFSKNYRDEMQRAYLNFAQHCDEKKWHETSFEFYLNNKVYYRKNTNNCVAPWIFDEPYNTQDFWALRWYGINWHQALSNYKGKAKMWYRTDVSYQQYQRNMLWGVTDMECVGGANDLKERLKRDEQVLWNKSHAQAYGNANPVDASNSQPAFWVVSTFTRGFNKTLPWNSIGSKNAMKQAERTAVFYLVDGKMIPSVRLKSFRAGQQLVEYAFIYKDAFNHPRYAVENMLKANCDLSSEFFKRHPDDAGLEQFKSKSADLWELRQKLGQLLHKKAPAYKRSLNELKTPERDMNNLPDIGYVSVGPNVPASKPDCEVFRPTGK